MAHQTPETPAATDERTDRPLTLKRAAAEALDAFPTFAVQAALRGHQDLRSAPTVYVTLNMERGQRIPLQAINDALATAGLDASVTAVLEPENHHYSEYTMLEIHFRTPGEVDA